MAEHVTDPADPERCQAVTNNGQCPSRSTNGKAYCLAHGGLPDTKTGLRNYRLTKWRAKIEHHADSPAIKSLRDEIGILRTIMEERLERIKDSHELIMQSGPIADLIMKIEKVVASCHRLEGSLGQTLDKTAVLNFAGIVIQILQDALVNQPEILRRIADEIMSRVSEIGTTSLEDQPSDLAT